MWLPQPPPSACSRKVGVWDRLCSELSKLRLIVPIMLDAATAVLLCKRSSLAFA